MNAVDLAEPFCEGVVRCVDDSLADDSATTQVIDIAAGPMAGSKLGFRHRLFSRLLELSNAWLMEFGNTPV